MNFQKLKVRLQSGQLLTQKQIKQLSEMAIDLLIQQGNLVQVKSPQCLVGDIHGQFYDFLKMIKEVRDYVDRGYHSIQTISYLIIMKCMYPDRFVMLRGNHQTSSLTRTYGFYDQVQKKYGNHNVWNYIIEFFTYLPLAAVIDDQILCLHGGLSPSLPYLDDLFTINRIKDIPELGPMADIVWSDPDPGLGEGWTINNRGAGYLFSKQVVKQFLELNHLKTIVRAHQLVQEGHIYNFGDESFVTLWSAPNYCYRCGNIASIMKIQVGKEYQFINFNAASQQSKNKIHFEYILPYFL